MPSTASLDGHPIHAMLIAFPSALFPIVVLFDILYYYKQRDAFWARCSYVILLLGVLGTLAAAIPGLIDYLTMWPSAGKPPVATRHLIVGLTTAVLSIINLALRRPRGKGEDAPRVILPLSVVVAALLMYQGYLGGELVYRYQAGMIPAEAAQTAVSPVAPITSGKRQVAPVPAVSAAMEPGKTYFDPNCKGCHKIAGSGGTMGPDLSHEGALHDKPWIILQIQNPKVHKPDSPMPPFARMPAAQVDAVAAYLVALK